MPGGISSRMGGALIVLAVFTFWITWEAKTLEGGLRQPDTVAFQGKPAPNFTLSTVDGKDVTLAEYRGKKNVVISFWASWCGPCRMELPMLRAFYQRLHPQAGDFEILAINTDDTREDAQQAAREMQLPFPVLIDAENKTASSFGVSALPTLVIIDKAGVLQYRTVGFDPRIESILASMLQIDPKLLGKGLDARPGN